VWAEEEDDETMPDDDGFRAVAGAELDAFDRETGLTRER